MQGSKHISQKLLVSFVSENESVKRLLPRSDSQLVLQLSVDGPGKKPQREDFH